MARKSRGELEHSDWFFLGWDFATQTVSMEMATNYVFLDFIQYNIFITLLP